MSALKENQCYGLSSGKLDRGGNVSVFHVKLTDSAARAVESFQKAKGSSHPTISFNGNQGRITIPCSDNDMRIFTFGMTIVGSDNPQGSFDCVQQLSTGAAEELSCLGVIQKKMTVNATDDSYDKARQSMAQAEEETRSRGAIVIKHGGRYQGKKVTVRAPSPALARLAKPRNLSQTLHCNTKRRLSISKSQKCAFASNGKNKSEVKERPLRERVKHLLALRPYKKPDLILRLQKDELTAEDRNELESVLMEVGQLNSKDNTFVLKDSLFKDVQKDWPGYTTGDQQLLKRILVRRLFQPQRNLLTVPEAQVSPLRDTPNSSPAHRPVHSQTKRYTDPLAHKKPRISHISNKTAKEQSGARPSQQEIHKDLTEPTGNDGQKNLLDPRRLLDSLSAVCQQEAVDRFEPTPCAQEEPKATAERPQPNSDRSPSASRPDGDTIKRKRHKNRDQEDKWRDKKNRMQDQRSEEPTNSVSLDCTQPCEILDDTNAIQDTDYQLTYTVICSYDQRQSYKQEFNREYSEYRDLHARIENVTRQFMELNAQLKQLNHKSLKYKMVHLKIIQEYRKIRKSNPDYRQEKIRCEYLHNKLAHIKKLISEYDQQQLCLAEED